MLGAQDVGAVEVGRLEDDIHRLRIHLGINGAEHAGDHQRPAHVGDHQIAYIQGALDLIEGDDPLTWLGAPHDQPAALDARAVEGVQRLADGQHDVVGDIDDITDGPHAGVGEARLQPRRRLGDVQSADHAGAVARAEVRIDHLDGDICLGRRTAGRGLRHRRRGQRQPSRSGHLAGDSVDTETVRPVGRDLYLQHRLGDRQILRQRRAHRPVRRQDDYAGAVVFVAQLFLAEHHAV